MYKKCMKKINFAVSEVEYQRLLFIKSALGFKTVAGCFRFFINRFFYEFFVKKKNCSDFMRTGLFEVNSPRASFDLSRLHVREELVSFRDELNCLLEFLKK